MRYKIISLITSIFVLVLFVQCSLDNTSTSPLEAVSCTTLSGSWYCPYLDSVGDVSTVSSGGDQTSIACDSSDNVDISYRDYENNNLKVASNASGSWIYYTVDSNTDVGRYSSIAIDNNDRIHISYFDTTDGNLKYAHSN